VHVDGQRRDRDHRDRRMCPAEPSEQPVLSMGQGDPVGM
jgi:hypothetical protein